MAVIIKEPDSNNPLTQDWINMLLKLSQISGSFSLIDFTEKQTNSIPQIIKGSRFELNGSIYVVQENEAIINWNIINYNIRAYIYANILDSQGDTEFLFDTVAPSFQIEKGGWFHPSLNRRCLMSCFKQSSNCIGKMLIEKHFDHPIGELYFSNTLTNPSLIHGGYWERVANGKVIVGIDETDTDFIANKTGGTKTQTLTSANLPSHSHTSAAHSHSITTISNYGDTHLTHASAASSTGSAKTIHPNMVDSTTPPNTGAVGSGTGHNNLQPYVTKYIFERKY